MGSPSIKGILIQLFPISLFIYFCFQNLNGKRYLSWLGAALVYRVQARARPLANVQLEIRRRDFPTETSSLSPV